MEREEVIRDLVANSPTNFMRSSPSHFMSTSPTNLRRSFVADDHDDEIETEEEHVGELAMDDLSDRYVYY